MSNDLAWLVWMESLYLTHLVVCDTPDDADHRVKFLVEVAAKVVDDSDVARLAYGAMDLWEQHKAARARMA